MKKIIRLFSIFGTAALLFTACEMSSLESSDATRADSPLDANELQAFIYGNTSDVVIKPAGDKFAISYALGADTCEVQKYYVEIGRHIDDESQAKAESFTLDFVDKNGAFTFDNNVSFAAGETKTKIEITSDLSFGESATLVLSIPKDCRSTYGGASSVEIEVSLDYTWEDRGSVSLSEYLFELSGSCKIQKAKEYKGKGVHASDSLFRLESPYFAIDTDEEIEEGVKPSSKAGSHFEFILDKDYNIVDLNIPMNASGYGYIPCGVTTGYIYWFPAPHTYSSYMSLSNTGNAYNATVFFVYQGEGYYTEMLDWVWEDGCPASLKIDPAEGEGTVDVVSFVDAYFDAPYFPWWAIGANVTDMDAFQSDAPETEDSYEMNFLYDLYLMADDGASGLYLPICISSQDATGKFELEFSNDWKYLQVQNQGMYYQAIGTFPANTIQAGYFDGTYENGCVFYTGLTKFYLTSGKVKLTLDEGEVVYAEVDAKTGKGFTFKGVYGAQ